MAYIFNVPPIVGGGGTGGTYTASAGGGAGNSYGINPEQYLKSQNTITFHAGNPSVEMLKVSPKGFWVRGVKVEQDDKEAEIVYNAFKSWMMWAELNRK